MQAVLGLVEDHARGRPKDLVGDLEAVRHAGRGRHLGADDCLRVVEGRQAVRRQYAPVALPAPEPGEDLALVACEAIEAALGGRQQEIVWIGLACADQDIDAGWVLAYMYE